MPKKLIFRHFQTNWIKPSERENMKKLIAVLLIGLSIAGLCGCGAKKQETPVKKQLEGIANAYVGDTVIEDSLKLETLDIEVKDKTFYIEGIKFRFEDFKNDTSRTAKLGERMLTAYVTDGALEKVEITEENRVKKTQYDAKGVPLGCTTYERDTYGNITLMCSYAADGRLKDFYTATYNQQLQMLQRKDFNADYDLVTLTIFEYDTSGELARELIYGGDLKLQDIKEH